MIAQVTWSALRNPLALEWEDVNIECNMLNQTWWHTSIILALWGAESGGSQIQGQPGLRDPGAKNKK